MCFLALLHGLVSPFIVTRRTESCSTEMSPQVHASEENKIKVPKPESILWMEEGVIFLMLNICTAACLDVRMCSKHDTSQTEGHKHICNADI